LRENINDIKDGVFETGQRRVDGKRWRHGHLRRRFPGDGGVVVLKTINTRKNHAITFCRAKALSFEGADLRHPCTNDQRHLDVLRSVCRLRENFNGAYLEESYANTTKRHVTKVFAMSLRSRALTLKKRTLSWR
jgi:hypothetical protein